MLTINCNLYKCSTCRKKKKVYLKRPKFVKKIWEANGKRPLPIMFNMVEQTLHPIGENAKLFSRCVGNEIKFFVPLYYHTWMDVLEHLRRHVLNVVEAIINLNSIVNLFH